MPKKTLAQRFAADDAARQPVLDRARKCAAVTKQHVLPQHGQTANDKLPDIFQSLGPRGFTSLEGKMLTALYGTAWFRYQVSERMRRASDADPQAILNIDSYLYHRTLILISLLESAGMKESSRPRLATFRSAKRMAISQLLITGDALEKLRDDYRIQVFRRDGYVTKRDACGDVLYHITKAMVDPLTLTREQIETAKLDFGQLQDQDVSERMKQLYTVVEYQPLTKTWVERQEVCDITIYEKTEPVNPYISTAFDLIHGEDYGRGHAENIYGDLRSYDNLREKMLDFAAAASRMHPFLDENSQIKESDFKKPSGTVLRGKVAGGQVQDAAMLQANKFADFQVVREVTEDIRKDLGGSLLLESEVTPNKDRVTKAQIMRIAQEVDGAIGGFYGDNADQNQGPLAQRLAYQAERDKIVEPIPEKYRPLTEVRMLTGFAALTASRKAEGLLNFVSTAKLLGPEAESWLDMDIVTQLIARFNEGADEPGVIKTPERRAQDRAAEAKAALALQAGGKAVEVAGDVAANNLMQVTP